MKKYIPLVLTVLLLAFKTNAQVSQSFKPFKMDLGFGVAPASSGSDGMLMYFEPSYTIAGQYKAGLRFEQDLQSMNNTGSTLLAIDYYFTNNPGIRLFAGGGYGFYNSNPTGGCDPGPTTLKITRTTKSTGGMVRMGFELAHFRLGMEFNFAPSTYVTAMGNSDQTSSTVIYKNEYLGIKAGILIGGGKKARTSAP